MSAQDPVQELAAQLLDELRRGDQFGPVPSAPGVPDGLLTRIEQWSVRFGDATQVAVQAALADLEEVPTSGPLGVVLPALAELALAFSRVEAEGADALLELRPPRIADSPGTASRWAVMTPITDVPSLIQQLLSPVPSRAHYRKGPPPVGICLTEAHDPTVLAGKLGLRLRDALDLAETREPRAVANAIRAIVPGVAAADPSTGHALQSLIDHDPAALREAPFVSLIMDALSAGAEDHGDIPAQFVHVIDAGALGYFALIWFPEDERLSRRRRTHLAGHIRYLADHYVAPWNRWAQRPRRREALEVYVRHLANVPLDAEGLARSLRERHSCDYGSEAVEVTTRRLYRMSTKLNGTFLPRSRRAPFGPSA